MKIDSGHSIEDMRDEQAVYMRMIQGDAVSGPLRRVHVLEIQIVCGAQPGAHRYPHGFIGEEVAIVLLLRVHSVAGLTVDVDIIA